MSVILTEKSSAAQALIGYRCPCGSIKLKKNGSYSRKTHLGNSKVLCPVPIQRIYCHDCNHTFGLLPEWLPPRRWYIWKTQEQVLVAYLLSTSISMINKQLKIARSTIRRWVNRFKERFDCHAEQLKQFLPDVLGCTNNFVSFWLTALGRYSLVQAMCYLHNSGIATP